MNNAGFVGLRKAFGHLGRIPDELVVGKGPPARISRNVTPSTYSLAMYGVPSCSPIS